MKDELFGRHLCESLFHIDLRGGDIQDDSVPKLGLLSALVMTLASEVVDVLLQLVVFGRSLVQCALQVHAQDTATCVLLIAWRDQL